MLEKTYTISSNFTNIVSSVGIERFVKELEDASINIKIVSFSEDETEIVVKLNSDLGDWTSIDNIVTAHTGEKTFEELKEDKIEEVKDKTKTLLSQGFTYDSSTFDILETTSNLKWINIKVNAANWGYPLTIYKIDETEYSLTNQAAADSFYDAYITRYQSILNGESSLIKSINAAANQAALDAIVDDRI